MIRLVTSWQDLTFSQVADLVRPCIEAARWMRHQGVAHSFRGVCVCPLMQNASAEGCSWQSSHLLAPEEHDPGGAVPIQQRVWTLAAVAEHIPAEHDAACKHVTPAVSEWHLAGDSRTKSPVDVTTY